MIKDKSINFLHLSDHDRHFIVGFGSPQFNNYTTGETKESQFASKTYVPIHVPKMAEKHDKYARGVSAACLSMLINNQPDWIEKLPKYTLDGYIKKKKGKKIDLSEKKPNVNNVYYTVCYTQRIQAHIMDYQTGASFPMNAPLRAVFCIVQYKDKENKIKRRIILQSCFLAGQL